jgi:hypothetical protein
MCAVSLFDYCRKLELINSYHHVSIFCISQSFCVILWLLDAIIEWDEQLKGGDFPELRYSDLETKRLLAEAYAAIPPRAGKRGTLNLKRQKRRWFIKRQYDYKKKRERIAAHQRYIEKGKKIKQEIKNARVEAADVRKQETAYQSMVLQRWAEMNGHSPISGTSNEGAERLIN